MVRWRLSELTGQLAGVPVDAVLAAGGSLSIPSVETSTEEAQYTLDNWLTAQLAVLEANGQPAWLVLPEDERAQQPQWQERLPQTVEVTFGRSGVTLAVGQAVRLQTTAVIMAVDSVPGSTPDKRITSLLRLELVPDASGLMIHWGLVDGRPGRPTELSALLQEAQEVAPVPEVLIMPGTGGDDLRRLIRDLSALEHWVDQGVRWEFAEARIGPMGAVGSLFNRYWLQEGYRLGEWQGQAVIVDVDNSPLAGLSVLDFNA